MATGLYLQPSCIIILHQQSTEVVEAMFCFFDYQHIWIVIVCWGDIFSCLFVNYLFCWHTVASYRETSVYSLDNCPWILASLVRSVLVFFRHIQETLLCFLHLSFDFRSRAFQQDHLGLIVLWPTGYLWWSWPSYLSYVHCLALFSSWCLPWFMS